MEWKIEIEKIENGYIVVHQDEMTNSTVKTIFEEDPDNPLEYMKNLLWFINNHFGEYYSKHNKKNIVIEIEDTN